jgi:hypothetical protein
MIIGMIKAHPTENRMARRATSRNPCGRPPYPRLRHLVGGLRIAVGLLGLGRRRSVPPAGQGHTVGDLAGHVGQLAS